MGKASCSPGCAGTILLLLLVTLVLLFDTLPPEPGELVSIRAAADLRDGPGKNFAVVGSLVPGERVTIASADSGGWMLVRGPRGEGWLEWRPACR